MTMSEYGFTKKDWVLFREKIADWQEAYMDKLNKEYIELLNGEGTPSEKFWTLEERIRNDKKDTGVQLRMSRSVYYLQIVTKLRRARMNLEIYQKLCSESKVLWTQHCLQRMQERDISRADVKNGIATGEIIEDYPEDYPNPSCLIFGYNVNGRILHIVAGCDNINIYIITAYYPDTKKFENDLKTRRKR